ncbi:MAG: polysaccharide deacetylase family protein [Balneolaceae bacterium]|nr:polysaccharide deacetylase family protein [Balneolaceae bacterium]
MDFCTTYREVKARKPGRGFGTRLRQQARGAALHLLYRVEKLRGLRENLRRPRVQFLYLHHVFADEEQSLRELLEFLARDHAFLSHSEAVERILEGRVDRPYISFSLDDGMKNNLRAGRIFREYGVRACFFLNPALVGETDGQTIKAHCEERLSFPPVEFLNWEQVAELQGMGHEIGSHSLRHRNLAGLSEGELREDLQRSREILLERTGEGGHFAFPYGRFHHFSERARRLVFETGHTSCATAEKGAHVNPPAHLAPRDLCIRRNQVKLDWDLGQILYFVSRDSRRASPENNLFPYR